MNEELSITSPKTWAEEKFRHDLEHLRKKAPLVHCITNSVVTNFTANVLLAIGASPAMVVTIEEAPEFVAITGALLINVGTITTADAYVMLKTAEAATMHGTPWVLDPVAAGAIGFRTGVTHELIACKPTVIRGNASEILALSGEKSGAKGVDSTASSQDALHAAAHLAHNTGAIVALSGETDYITDGTTVSPVPGGHHLMTRVTGTGCTLGATIAAFLATSPDPMQAATTASVIFAHAGAEAAKGNEHRTGSFAVAFLDRLSSMGVN
ncbi:hydroxyethylthiazole kinase [Prosthecochloris sp. HL-130-GSB]|jgi:hydroxyethylthiazole kinase|uniref:hydroxyethylthiazole kinase n=1 Tax=Prosthecochloris sp. HL-130-GSB TaxID=1974213 RepID=UPI000A1C0E2E|nr:hydroxyethylthiazole kinase [Prosthecochloris sp. HL-130-GSB]ARM31700.1 hydroxyethylthiazole kinase [Prosthecochloris sp. HL-130-GSB]